MEAVNQATTGNLVALHTTAGCTMADARRDMAGTAGQADCHNATNSNAGCNVRGQPATYGPDFNTRGGGVVALEWRTEGIRVWVFPRDADTGVTALPVQGDDEGAPDPSVWGPPLADFPATSCDISSHFRNQSIVVNIDLCGYLTEAVWESSGCSESLSRFGENENLWLMPDRSFEVHRLRCRKPFGFQKRLLGIWRSPSIQGAVKY